MASDGRQNDEQLALLARDGDVQALERLVTRYAKVFRAKDIGLSSVGLDSDDVTQEVMIAVIDAVGSYSPGGGASFATYAAVCINNRIRSLIRSHSGSRNRPLNESILFGELSELGAADTQQLPLKFSEDPEALVIEQEYDRQIWQQIVSVLSDFELAVFRAHLSGFSYKETAEKLGCSVKSVDNALQRSKLKLKSIEF